MVAATGLLAVAALGQIAGPPKIDKQKLTDYIRYAEGFTQAVQIAIDDPVTSPYKGLFRLVVHLTMGPTRIDKVYYVSSDGTEVLAGAIWELSQSPFQETLSHLPASGPSFGPADAKVTIVIFSDFQCPYCRELAKTVRDNVSKNYPKDVRVVFENFPIESIHPWAHAAAEAAACIADQKVESFWEFHDWIFQHQGEISAINLKEKALAFAKDQSLDTAKLSTCIDTHSEAHRVDEDIAAGRALQIQQTPTSFVNGRLLPGAVSWETLNTVIKMELNPPAKVNVARKEKCCEVSMPKIANR